MRKIVQLFVAGVILLSASAVSAQDEANRWSFSIGVNAVDLFPVGEKDSGLGDYFDEFFNTNHYNVMPAPSRFEAGYYVGDGIVATGAFSINNITRAGETRIDELSYISLDAGLRYNLREIWNGNDVFNPYLGVGGSYQWLDDDGFMTFNGTAGFDVKVMSNIYVNVNTIYKHAFEDGNPKHWQHSVGVKFIWGAADTDGDGIVDTKDACPEVAGLEQFNGCPDSDLDGIVDSKDACPQTAGPAETMGCPDSDGDTVLDKDDACPDVAGLVAMKGCPDPDTDNDGIKDSADNCPNKKGPAANNGCPYTDKDNDGVLDKDDDCPTVPGIKSLKGCPKPAAPTREEQAQLNSYAKTILFDTAKSSIKAQSAQVLSDITSILKKYPSANFAIEGHTDSVGSESSNQRLSDSRAAAVKSYLVNAGINSSRLTSRGYGESRPVASNKTRDGRAQNRRVEINLTN